MRIARGLTLASTIVIAALSGPGCSTTSTIAPSSAPLSAQIELPSYASLPHPQGYTSSDLKQLLTNPAAPASEALDRCKSDLETLFQRVEASDERNRGVSELVAHNPSVYHWCFYSSILKLEDALAQAEYVDEKQKAVIQAYEYLVPVARAFMSEFHDSRYLRWAIRDYRRLSDLYFFRKLDLSPDMSSTLVEVEYPFARDTQPSDTSSEKAVTVLDKYKVTETETDQSLKASQLAKSEPAKEKAVDPNDLPQEIDDQVSRAPASVPADTATSVPAGADLPLPAPAKAQ